jgi:hypothetical protein
MNLRRTIGLILVGAGVLVGGLKLAKVYDPVPVIERLGTKAGPKVSNFIKKAGPQTVMYVLLVALPIGLGAILLAASRSKGQPEKVEEHPTDTAVWKSQRAGKKTPVQSCNVLQAEIEPRQLWHFDARNGGFVLNRQQTAPPGQALPPNLVAKDWRSLFQRKLNVAWLPCEHVFLRVAQFPLSDFKETLSMVELQLEKLSPLPVAQIVWSVDVLPHPTGNMQTVIVLIVARSVVEEFLGKLEGQGYLADALELPVLDQLRATAVAEDGVWIYPQAVGGKNAGLAAWWYGGVLQNLDLLNLSGNDKAGGVQEQLTQMAWAGELEGWLTAPPRYHLVASGEAVADWEPVLRGSVEQPLKVVEGLPPARLAAATAQRAAQTADSANLLPAEFSTRYQQQFYDRLWMRGLFAVAGLYVLGVVVYMLFLGFKTFQVNREESAVVAISNQYTNAIQTHARYSVLKERQDLKYLALDCWNKVAELLPASVTLEGFTFSDGKRLALNGTAPGDQVQQIFNFDAALRKAKKDDDPLFDALAGETPTYTSAQGGNINWRLMLELKRTEVK